MKAIRITEQNKVNFSNLEVGKVYRRAIPKRYIIGNDTLDAYDTRTQRHLSDGWKDVIQPIYDNDTQKLGEFIENEDNFTYEVIDLTQAEIDAKIPTQISKLNFKLGLLINHGITNDNVLAVINGVEDVVQREMLKLLWNESNVIERTDENLLAFAPALGLTEEDLKVIHRDFVNYR